MVGPGRLERPTSRLSGVRSNQLSYGPGTGFQQGRDQRPRTRISAAQPVAAPTKQQDGEGMQGRRLFPPPTGAQRRRMIDAVRRSGVAPRSRLKSRRIVRDAATDFVGSLERR